MSQRQRVASLDHRLLRAQYHTRTALSAHPGVFLPFVRYRHRRGDTRVVRSDTELVIDGFQRSGKTFAVVASELAQRRRVVVAHHVHAAAQIHEAVKLRVPTILLIRTPDALRAVERFAYQRYVRVRMSEPVGLPIVGATPTVTGASTTVCGAIHERSENFNGSLFRSLGPRCM